MAAFIPGASPPLVNTAQQGDEEEWEKHLEANHKQGHRRYDPRRLQGGAAAVTGLRAPTARTVKVR